MLYSNAYKVSCTKETQCYFIFDNKALFGGRQIGSAGLKSLKGDPDGMVFVKR